jgi:uncharacterized protein (DUF433 family)
MAKTQEAVREPQLLSRITVRPDVFGGKPIVRDMRISVDTIVSLMVQGETQESILADFPDLEPDNIRACLAYARASLARSPKVGLRRGEITGGSLRG